MRVKHERPEMDYSYNKRQQIEGIQRDIGCIYLFVEFNRRFHVTGTSTVFIIAV